MTKGLNWREQMHWELYKQYLRTPNETYVVNYNVDDEVYTKTVYTYRKINEAYAEALIATEQFINGLAADAREQLEHQGWKESDFKSMIKDNTEKWTNQSNWNCYDAVERAISGTPLTNLDHD